jgi:hypothetical protein
VQSYSSRESGALHDFPSRRLISPDTIHETKRARQPCHAGRLPARRAVQALLKVSRRKINHAQTDCDYRPAAGGDGRRARLRQPSREERRAATHGNGNAKIAIRTQGSGTSVFFTGMAQPAARP